MATAMAAAIRVDKKRIVIILGKLIISAGLDIQYQITAPAPVRKTSVTIPIAIIMRVLMLFNSDHSANL